MSFQQIVNFVNPKKLFLIDSLGALLSAFMLGIILVRFEDTFGMPQKVLYFLAFIACIFSVYSFLGFLGITKNWRPYMKIIAMANLVYCCFTMALVIFLFQKLTILGLTYFILEIIVVIMLVIIELKTASNTTLSL